MFTSFLYMFGEVLLFLLVKLLTHLYRITYILKRNQVKIPFCHYSPLFTLVFGNFCHFKKCLMCLSICLQARVFIYLNLSVGSFLLLQFVCTVFFFGLTDNIYNTFKGYIYIYICFNKTFKSEPVC